MDAYNKLKTSVFSDGDEREKIFSAVSVKTVDIEKRQVRVLASTGDLDRHGDILPPEAFKKRLHMFKKNPVILACHKHNHSDGTAPVIGRADSIWIDKRGLWCVIEFAKTALAEQYWQLYRDGYMKAVSVGFQVIESHTENLDGKTIYVYDEVELYEISAVAVPANREALAKSREKKRQFVQSKRAESLEELERKMMVNLGYPEDQIEYSFSQERIDNFAKCFCDGESVFETEKLFVPLEDIEKQSPGVGVGIDFSRHF